MPLKEDKLISAAYTADDLVVDNVLRPRRLKDYVGQQLAVQQLEIAIKAAQQRQEPLDHVLLLGPPGLGKTTLARIIAVEMAASISSSAGPVLDKGRDIAALLSNLENRDVLFIDELHRLNPAIEEILYPAMEDYKIDIILGDGAASRPLSLQVAPFTLIGATTRSGLLTSPLRDRFGITLRLDFYEVESLTKIVLRSARLLEIDLEAAGAKEIAKRARGTPRIANRILRRVRDYVQVQQAKNDCRVTAQHVRAALELIGIDEGGLDETDRRLLEALIDKFAGGPVGIGNLAASLQEDKETLEDVVEPYLIQQGLIKRTQRGRVASELAYQRLGVRYQPKEQNLL